MSRFFLMLAALIGIGAAAPAQAYWELGHETIARIAYRNVTPQVRAAIDRMLARADMLETAGCPANTIEDASTWADCIKKLGPRFSYAYSWHYQNVNICRPFDLKAACKDGNCVSAQIERDVKILKDADIPLRERIQALAFLIHFVGDLHMPLHAGDHDDLGGNRLKAAYGWYAPERLNLHSIWDGPLAERAISTAPSLVRVYAPSERAAVWGGSVEDWSRESWMVSRDVAYRSAIGGDPCTQPEPARVTLSNAVIAELVAPARLQIERGGLRLARLLDEALGGGDPAKAGG
ncbi:MAG: S1/P1 nuclease [Pseudomonadota bacterium]